PHRRGRGADAARQPRQPGAGAHKFGSACRTEAGVPRPGAEPGDQHHRLEVPAGGHRRGRGGAEGGARAGPRAGPERRMTPLLLILSAPSGTGKTTLARRLVAAHPGAVFSVSYTTRPPRAGEKDGVDYHFVRKDRFRKMNAEGA